MEQKDELDLFGMCYGPNTEHQEYVYIKANPAGLRRFAGDLLEVADKLETTNLVSLTGKGSKYDWHQSEQFIYYVEKVTSIRDYYKEQEVTISPWQEIAFKAVLGFVALFILVCFVAGLIAIGDYFF